MLKVEGLRCEYRRNPIGIHSVKPRLSWILISDRRDVLQTAYRVQVKEGNAYFANLRKARQEIEYILKDEGEEVFEPHFTFQGFRYVKVVDFPGEPGIENFTGVVIHSDLEQKGSFRCSNGLINKLQHNILWSQKGNFVDIPSDCPQRDERLGWTADAQIFLRTASFNMNTVAFFEKWLKDLQNMKIRRYNGYGT